MKTPSRKAVVRSYCLICKTYEVWDSARFCSNCGAVLKESPPVLECGYCHGEVKESHKFCIYCGAKFKEDRHGKRGKEK